MSAEISDWPANTPVLLLDLVRRHGLTRLTPASLPPFVAQHRSVVLVFTEDPLRYRETLDLAVIVPQLMHAFPGRFAAALLLADDARACHAKYGFRRWPALVVLRDGVYVGAIDGLRDWDGYLVELAALLDAPLPALAAHVAAGRH